MIGLQDCSLAAQLSCYVSDYLLLSLIWQFTAKTPECATMHAGPMVHLALALQQCAARVSTHCDSMHSTVLLRGSKLHGT
jgi:hypothetical protein